MGKRSICVHACVCVCGVGMMGGGAHCNVVRGMAVEKCGLGQTSTLKEACFGFCALSQQTGWLDRRRELNK